MRCCPLMLLAALELSCLTHPKAPPATDVMLETDDGGTPETARLVDVSWLIDTHVNQILRQVRAAQQTPDHGAWTPEAKIAFLRAVSDRLAGPRRGTGVGVGTVPLRVEISVLTEIEAWLMESLSPERREIAYIPFEKSLYGENPIGLFKAKVPAHATRKTANHSLAPVIRLRNTLIGIDKLAHFLEQGFWYFDATFRSELLSPKERWEWGAFMEGHPDLDKALYGKYKRLFGKYCPTCVIGGGFGYYGSASTGVISLADLAANEDGFQFYLALSQNMLGYTFHVTHFDLKNWNEMTNKSLFIPGLEVESTPQSE